MRSLRLADGIVRFIFTRMPPRLIFAPAPLADGGAVPVRRMLRSVRRTVDKPHGFIVADEPPR
jgi:hypothetical protein